MTQDESLKKLAAIVQGYGSDAEAEHAETDKLMLSVLRSSGYAILADKIEKLWSGWWWA